MLATLLEGLRDLLSPPTCAACRAPLAARALGFCDGCAPLIERLPVERDARQLAACAFGGPLRDALHRLKYDQASEVAAALWPLLVPAARALGARVDCVCAVPLHARRLRVRGYNQSALLARPLARSLDLPFFPWLLVRGRDAPPQVGKGASARRCELAHAFAARRSARGRACLVIDDVRTTGATLAEAERALYAAGARRVCTLALGRVEESDPLAGL